MILALIWIRVNFYLLKKYLVIFIVLNADGADDCDRMAKIHKCGVDKDPDLVSNMIQVGNLEGTLVRMFYSVMEKLCILLDSKPTSVF